uniref:Inositol-3-phosphate synthase 1 n=1 Tax=Rhinopithecus bieti TaxID=61621 RepID=A0A2K6N0P1_RHIBE
MEAAAQFFVESPDVVYGPEAIEAQYEYRTTRVSREGGVLKVHPTSTRFTFRTARQVPRLGVMLVGWGGNNGSTLTAAVLANRLRLSWPTRSGRKVGAGGAWWAGRLGGSGTVKLGLDPRRQEVFVPFPARPRPMVAPNTSLFDGGRGGHPETLPV